MKCENGVDFQVMSENYTYVFPETLQKGFSSEEPSLDDVVRERPSEPLRERGVDEIAQLRSHPLFAEDS